MEIGIFFFHVPVAILVRLSSLSLAISISGSPSDFPIIPAWRSIDYIGRGNCRTIKYAKSVDKSLVLIKVDIEEEYFQFRLHCRSHPAVVLYAIRTLGHRHRPTEYGAQEQVLTFSAVSSLTPRGPTGRFLGAQYVSYSRRRH